MQHPKSTQPDSATQLARKVAHELNSPLDGVMRFISLAQRKLNDKSSANPATHADILRYLADAESGLQRIAEIIRELTEVTPSPLLNTPQKISLTALIHQVIATHQPTADSAGVILYLDLPPASTLPLVDPSLFQVLSNLLKNALEAMPNGGTATLSATFNQALSTKHLLLTITDTGPGLSPTHQHRLFEPFFTTKSNSPGHGLGLALSREILTKLNATITLRNRPTTPGCEAIITLPTPLLP